MPQASRTVLRAPSQPATQPVLIVRMPVDDLRAHAAPRELVGEHQPGRAGANDEDIGVHAGLPWRESSTRGGCGRLRTIPKENLLYDEGRPGVRIELVVARKFVAGL